MLELVCFHQTTGAVVLEDEAVSSHDIVSVALFREVKAILDQLEHQVVTRQRENQHHHPARSFRGDEPVGRGAKMSDKIPVKLRLAMPVETDCVIKINQSLTRHQLTQIAYELVRAHQLDPEISARVGK